MCRLVTEVHRGPTAMCTWLTATHGSPMRRAQLSSSSRLLEQHTTLCSPWHGCKSWRVGLVLAGYSLIEHSFYSFAVMIDERNCKLPTSPPTEASLAFTYLLDRAAALHCGRVSSNAHSVLYCTPVNGQDTNPPACANGRLIFTAVPTSRDQYDHCTPCLPWMVTV